MNAWRIVEGYRGTNDAGSPLSFNPLPFDDEISTAEDKYGQEVKMDSAELMRNAIESGYFNTPIWHKATS